MIQKWTTLSIEEKLKSITFKFFKAVRKSPTRDIQGEFDIIECYNSSSIIALTENNEVIMVRQYRHGQDKVTLELPGGVVPKGEDFELAAIRELSEETGYRCKKVSFLGKVDVNPALLTSEAHLFLAENCTLSGSQNLDLLEEIEIVLVPLIEIEDLIKSGEIGHSLTVAAFYYYSINN